MRRTDKEITSRSEIDEIIRDSDVCRLAFAVSDEPYLVPVSFGFDGKTLYFFRGGRYLDPSLAGIYVSHWVDTPLETAIKNVREAIAQKEAAVEELEASIAPVLNAINAIDEMLESE